MKHRLGSLIFFATRCMLLVAISACSSNLDDNNPSSQRQSADQRLRSIIVNIDVGGTNAIGQPDTWRARLPPSTRSYAGDLSITDDTPSGQQYVVAAFVNFSPVQWHYGSQRSFVHVVDTEGNKTPKASKFVIDVPPVAGLHRVMFLAQRGIGNHSEAIEFRSLSYSLLNAYWEIELQVGDESTTNYAVGTVGRLPTEIRPNVVASLSNCEIVNTSMSTSILYSGTMVGTPITTLAAQVANVEVTKTTYLLLAFDNGIPIPINERGDYRILGELNPKELLHIPLFVANRPASTRAPSELQLLCVFDPDHREFLGVNSRMKKFASQRVLLKPPN